MENNNNKEMPLSLLSGLKTSTDLVEFLEKNPESMRQLQEAILLTKRRTKMLASLKDEEEKRDLASENQIIVDPKNLNKAIKLISGPFNSENSSTLNLMLKSNSITVNSKNEAGDSLLKISLEYLKTKERVELDWPLILLNGGAKVGAQELSSVISLFIRRGDHYGSSSLGSNGLRFLEKMFSLKNNWGELENAISSNLKESDGSLLVFYKGKFARAYSSICWGVKEWQGLNNLISSGVIYPTKYQKIQKDQTFWQFISSVSCDASQEKQPDGSLKLNDMEYQNAHLERIRAFTLMKERDWFVHSCAVSVEDGLNSAFDAATSITGSNYIKVSPSRGFIKETPLIASSVDILKLLCEYEREKGIETSFDSVGRSRLFFVNERSRSAKSSGPEVHNVLKNLASVCLDYGDKIEWLNSQNPFAKATAIMLPWVNAQYDAQQIRQVIDGDGAHGAEVSSVVKKFKGL